MSTRTKVLTAFKELHRARQKAFREDPNALAVVRGKINDEFRKNMNNTDERFIKKQIKFANEVSEVLLKELVQFVQEPGSNRFVTTPRGYTVK